ncbi:hypothetical protein DRP05_04975 [Archaeoglobales archaeon]|nr:MAG: hypothetical protein DRP05_04975 [Archaeoglobales archaeon]
MSWQRGVAFVRGINMYKSKRISQEKMVELCRSIEDENLRIIRVVKTDNIVFEKRKIHYATVSQRLEKVLSEYFNERVYVTSRSMKTIKLLTRFEG